MKRLEGTPGVMSRAAAITLLTVLLAAVVGGQNELPPSIPQSESEIRAIVAAQAAAWNAGDGAAFGKDMSADVSFTNLFGVVMYGAPAFVERQKQILSTFFKGTTKIHSIRRIRFVTRDVAIVDIDNVLSGVKTLPAGMVVPPDGVLRTQLMQVFVRHSRGWQVEAFHNVDVKTQN
jgi:uncharacterized protein (TIGR02246 family)